MMMMRHTVQIDDHETYDDDESTIRTLYSMMLMRHTTHNDDDEAPYTV